MDKLIYFDNNSTTPVDPSVLETMLPYLKGDFGNAASRSHPFGWKTKAAVDLARDQIGELLHVAAKNIVFTSGATEAINLAIKGVFEAYHAKGNHIITAKTEHKAILDTCEYLEKKGAIVTYLDVSPDGLIDLDQLREAITPKTILVSIMWVNNETGVIQPIETIAEICRQNDVLFMSDATQAVGKMTINPNKVGVDLLAFSGHKLYAPKGIGGLYVHPSVKLSPIIHGGGHENGMRSGTLNVPGIVALGKAAAIAAESMDKEAIYIEKLRYHLERELLKIEQTQLNGHPTKRLYNVCNISFKYVESEALIGTFKHTVAVSSGSACTSASLEPSHVLLAQGLKEHVAASAIRFSLGKFNTLEEVERTVQLVKRGVELLRAESPVWALFKDGVDVDDLL